MAALLLASPWTRWILRASLAGGACLLLAGTLAVSDASDPGWASFLRETPTVHVEADVADAGAGLAYAQELRLRFGGRLALATRLEQGRLAPIPVRTLVLDARHALVLGWSSWGGGTTTQHALLLARQGDAVRLVDQIEMTGAAERSCLLVDEGAGGTRIGFAVAREGAPELWSLHHRGQSWEHEQLVAAPRGGASTAELWRMGGCEEAGVDDADVLWVDVGPAGLRLPPGLGDVRR